MGDIGILSAIYAWQRPTAQHRDAWLIYGPFYDKRWVNDGTISPLTLYCYLKARFGSPNGPTMAVRHPSPSNIFQWHYVVAHNDRVMHFICRTDNLELVPQCDSAPNPDEWRDFVVSLKTEFGKHGPDISAVRETLEKWQLFVNPFARLNQIIHSFETRVAGQTPLNLPRLPRQASKARVKELSAELEQFTQEMADLQAACLALKILAPVWGESFVNLLLLVLAKPELKSDERLYGNLIRQEIDIRIRRLHLDCVGFATAVDPDSDEFKQFHTLMNQRNDVLHGNVNPTALRFDHLCLDSVSYDSNGPHHQIPLFKDERNLADRLMQGLAHGITPECVLRDVGVVRKFIASVLACIRPSYREPLQVVMANPYPGWREDTGRIGVLFDDALVFGIISESGP